MFLIIYTSRVWLPNILRSQVNTSVSLLPSLEDLDGLNLRIGHATKAMYSPLSFEFLLGVLKNLSSRDYSSFFVVFHVLIRVDRHLLSSVVFDLYTKIWLYHGIYLFLFSTSVHDPIESLPSQIEIRNVVSWP
ncbi:hypothetical protein ABKN59_011850 [Abortiporus biennis]